MNGLWMGEFSLERMLISAAEFYHLNIDISSQPTVPFHHSPIPSIHVPALRLSNTQGEGERQI